MAFLTAVLTLLAASQARANQVYKACGKKWGKQAKKLAAEQLAWMAKKSAAEFARDLDGDGLADRIVMTSTPSFRTCDVRKDWNRKETTLVVEYADGRKQLFHWINTYVVEKMSYFHEIGRILVVGRDVDGSSTSKWVDLGRPDVAPRPTLVASVQ